MTANTIGSGIALLSALALTATAQASVCAGYDAADYLSATDSAPDKMGWMQGSPPAPDKRIRLADGSFFRFPALRYSVAHMSEFLPTTLVSRRTAPAQGFAYALDTGIDELQLMPLGADEPISWEASLGQTYTDGIIVLYQGKVVYERYLDGFREFDRHALMSVTKSFTGTLALDLVHRGIIDETLPVAHYIPELKASGFGDATVKQLLDMTTGIDFDEVYADPKSEIWAFSAAGSPLPKPEGYEGPTGYLEYLPTVNKASEHGTRFVYRTANTEVLGWLISRVTGMSVADKLEQQIWSRIGMEHDALFQIDERGTPFSGGGLNVTLRDLARFGELIRNGGRYQGEQILHPDTVADILKGNPDIRLGEHHYPQLDGWSYRSMWWVTDDPAGSIMARGVHGQRLLVDPARELVIARFASHPVASNNANDCVTLPAFARVAEYLTESHGK